VQELCAEGERDGRILEKRLRAECEREARASVDYCAVVDEETLEPLEEIVTTARALMAVRIGKTRLIDNMQLRLM
jgi:pantoate--beta-alanine ligase